MVQTIEKTCITEQCIVHFTLWHIHYTLYSYCYLSRNNYSIWKTIQWQSVQWENERRSMCGSVCNAAVVLCRGVFQPSNGLLFIPLRCLVVRRDKLAQCTTKIYRRHMQPHTRASADTRHVWCSDRMMLWHMTRKKKTVALKRQIASIAHDSLRFLFL